MAFIAITALALSAATAAGPAAEAGGRIAQARCAACHSTGPEGRSANLSAPAFRDIRLRYNPISLERELVRIARNGHYEMKPTAISPDDAANLAAYIEALGPAR